MSARRAVVSNAEVLRELRELRTLIDERLLTGAVAGGVASAAVDGVGSAAEAGHGMAPRPLTSLQLIERWGVTGEGVKERLHNLRYRARSYGLRPLSGTRGRQALWALADVVRAEEFSAGRILRKPSTPRVKPGAAMKTGRACA